jgi:diguanylate cyclase (GGDEF)-like protein/PAS domain S-box-containing protein
MKKNNTKRFNEVSDISSDWGWEVNTQGIYTYVDSNVKDFLGYEIDEVIGKSPFDFMSRDEAKRVKKIFLDYLSKQLPFKNIENTNIHKNGTEVILETSATPVYDSDKNFIGYKGTDRDITKRVLYEKELQLASNVFKYSSDAIVITDRYNKIVTINKSFQDLTGYCIDEVKGKNPRVLSSGWGDREFYDDMWSDIIDKGVWKGEVWDRKKSGETYTALVSIVAIKDSNDQIINYMGISRDITEFKAREREIRQLAYYDFLTKLPNRKLFEQEVDSFIKSSHFNNKQFAIIFLDLDNFKWVNDSLGHHFGDKVLIHVSKAISEIIGEDSIFARLGGDEFVILSPYDEILSISQLATKVIDTTKDPITIDNTDLNLGWSIGISLFPQNATTYDELLKCADTAMYEAKENGKNNFQYFSESMNENAKKRLQIDTQLRSAIKQDEFSLVYQPKISSKDLNILGFETLLRWNNKELGFIPPDEFIPIAEQSGYIYDIGLWVIEKAFSDFNNIHNQNISKKFTLAINISGKQLEEENFLSDVKNLIKTTNVKIDSIEFEITETSLMNNIDKVIPVLNELKQLGITISIDDFGTGYSSMSYLKRMPIDTLKIDKTFISDLEHSDEDKAIVEATIALAKSLKLSTVAEGVETQNQSHILKNLECNIYQGYYYSKPLSLDNLYDFIDKQN